MNVKYVNAKAVSLTISSKTYWRLFKVAQEMGCFEEGSLDKPSVLVLLDAIADKDVLTVPENAFD